MEDWEINAEELEKVIKIGEGAFADVYIGRWTDTEKEVIIKEFRGGTTTQEAFLVEAAMMRNLQHDNLVTLFGICASDKSICVIQEYMCKGNLHDFLRSSEGRRLKIKERVHIAAHIASGMVYLGKRQIVHCNLAARSVYIGENLTAKVNIVMNTNHHVTTHFNQFLPQIGDFYSADLLTDNVLVVGEGIKFPIKWSAPEVLIDGLFTVKADVWSFGVLLMEIFTFGRIPYPDLTNAEVLDKISQGYRMPKPLNSILSNEIYEIMLKCWDWSKEQRPTFEFLQDYFENYEYAIET